MDDKVNDFLNEINEIAPAAPPQRPPPPPSKPEDQVWKQCYDELTGHAYYWNKKTDKVTWNPPEPLFNKATSKPQVSKKNMYIPTLYPGVNSSMNKDVPKDIKIYSIGDDIKKLPKKEPLKRPFKKGSDSEDEKITLISSYGTDSESENECLEEKKPKMEVKSSSSVIPETHNLDVDNIDILAKIHKRAQELKTLGGDIPPEVKDVVESSKTALLKSKKTVTGVSLVAGYSDSDEENEEIKAVLQSKDEQSQISHSTLFPITKPININDFKSPEKIENNTTINNCDSFDNKAFQRKRRIGIALVNTTKKHSEIDREEDLRKGFGFEDHENSSKPKDNMYQGLRIGGIAFEKSETLNPVTTTDEQQKSTSRLKENEDNLKNLEAINDMYSTLREKLTFLNEGRPDISPVQLMLIQAETLFMAMNDGALQLSYLQKWLKETCSELIKLEKEATPAGWMLQWEKTHKRYFYQNLTTGESKWEYPQPDLNTSDDAMDISTTPPPIDAGLTNPMSPPLPPTIRSPTPPPPPIISNINPEVNFKVLDVPLPKKPVSQPLLDSSTQPLPPGVDRHEIHTFTQPKEPESSDPLNSALDSFYSDIAAISSPPPTLPLIEDPILENNSTEIKTDMLKKKKKTKVKLAQGLVMKKKGVSKLVEKWKNLQQEY